MVVTHLYILPKGIESAPQKGKIYINYISIDFTFKKWTLSIAKRINSKFLRIKMEWKGDRKRGFVLINGAESRKGAGPH